MILKVLRKYWKKKERVYADTCVCGMRFSLSSEKQILNLNALVLYKLMPAWG